ncbi:Hypothetical predicted protein [Paramuricea clavata]|uniref:Uncharacterized protein n=1 Tax=Paramuricea clavata TaxID=317549 RepID=A0A6S7IIP2_PARCT|nr:Hypothetical predicted protein [Paramuricea clavata]
MLVLVSFRLSVTRIASVVAQAVVAAIQSPTPSAVVDTRDVPLNGRSETGAQVQGPVASALEHLTGENNLVVRPPSFGSHVQFNSITIQIDVLVSPKIKAKIWVNEFIEFGSLLNPYVGERKYQLSLAQSGSSVPTLSLDGHPIRLNPYTALMHGHQPSRFFLGGVYNSKFSQEAPKLTKYVEVVPDLAARGANLRFYDTQFRSGATTNKST